MLNQDLTTDDTPAGIWSFCEGRLQGHEKFGSCQQGVAATFTRDYHYVVFGAPGTYNWKGTVCIVFQLSYLSIFRISISVSQ